MFNYACFQIACLLFAGAALAAQPDNSPDLDKASVTIPYAELKTLWQAAQHDRVAEKPKPPMAAVLLSARYQLALDGDQATGFGDYEAESFTDDWTVIPLLGVEAQIEGFEPADARIITQDGRHVLVTNRAGKQKVKIRFAVKLAVKNEGAHLHIPVAPASINTLDVTGIPEKETLGVSDATEIAAKGNSASFRLPVQDHIDFDLVSVKTLEPPTPSSWKGGPQIFVEFNAGKLDYEARIEVHSDSGSGLSIDLEFPPDVNVSRITGDDLADWRVSTDGAAKQIAHLRWLTRDILRREFEIHYDAPQSVTATEWKMASPQIGRGTMSLPLYVAAPDAGLELTGLSQEPAPRVLPEWFAQHVRGRAYIAFVGDITLRAKWLPLVKTARAVAESARADMRIVADGAVLNEMEYTIRHDAAIAWKLDLPKGSELVACSVDRHAVNPVNRGDNSIEFTLPEGNSVSEVKISYTARMPAFKPISGQITIELPETDLLVDQIDWELRIPAKYEIAAFEGNVETRAGRSEIEGNSLVIRLHKELCKGERPSAELFYQKPESAK